MYHIAVLLIFKRLQRLLRTAESGSKDIRSTLRASIISQGPKFVSPNRCMVRLHALAGGYRVVQKVPVRYYREVAGLWKSELNIFSILGHLAVDQIHLTEKSP